MCQNGENWCLWILSINWRHQWQLFSKLLITGNELLQLFQINYSVTSCWSWGLIQSSFCTKTEYKDEHFCLVVNWPRCIFSLEFLQEDRRQKRAPWRQWNQLQLVTGITELKLTQSFKFHIIVQESCPHVFKNHAIKDNGSQCHWQLKCMHTFNGTWGRAVNELNE